jgi:hypothetical protein
MLPAARKIQYRRMHSKRIIVGFVLLLFTACGPSDTELAALQQAEDATQRTDSVEHAMVETMDEINRNLELIREKQGVIALTSPENLSKKNQILENIRLINSLLEDNRKKNDQLALQVRKLGSEKNAMARVADQTKERIRKQEQEIATLKELLEKESFKVADLNRKVETLETEMNALIIERDELHDGNAALDKDLNKAYFTYGTSEQLLSKELIEKKGGVFGLGQKEALAAAFHRNKASFTEIDVRNTSSIPLHGKKPRLLTDHPKGSYELTMQSGAEGYSLLVIKEPSDFWSRSRFAIVEVK